MMMFPLHPEENSDFTENITIIEDIDYLKIKLIKFNKF